jgi:hypothetical protein
MNFFGFQSFALKLFDFVLITVSLYSQVCGLAPLDRLLVVLALPKAQGEGEGEGDEEGEGEEEGPERPQLMVFEKSGQEYELVSTDLLTIK